MTPTSSPGIPGKMSHALLEQWRAAERRHRAATDPEDRRREAIAVAQSWAEYQAHISSGGPETILVADDNRMIVAAAGRSMDLLGYEASEITGRRVDDLAAPALAPATPALWEQFVRARRESKVFALIDKDGNTVHAQYRAETDVPLPGLHVSRLRPFEGDGTIG